MPKVVLVTPNTFIIKGALVATARGPWIGTGCQDRQRGSQYQVGDGTAAYRSYFTR